MNSDQITAKYEKNSNISTPTVSKKKISDYLYPASDILHRPLYCFQVGDQCLGWWQDVDVIKYILLKRKLWSFG